MIKIALVQRVSVLDYLNRILWKMLSSTKNLFWG